MVDLNLSFSRTQARHGDPSERDQYPDDRDYQGPQEVADPHTLEDDTSESLLQRAARYRWYLLSVGLLAVVGVAVLGIYFGRYFVTFLTNPWTIRATAVAVIFAAGYKLGIGSERAAVKEETEFTLYSPGGQTVTFRCEFRTTDASGYPVVVPYKGNTGWFGGDPNPYTIGDLSQSLATTNGLDADTEARIRLVPELAEVHQTDRGRKVIQQSAGLEPDPYGTESNLEAVPPETIDEETAIELSDLLTSLREDHKQLKERLDTIRRQRDAWKELAEENFEDFRKRVNQDVKTFTELLPNNRRGGHGGSETTPGRDPDDPPRGDPLRAERAARNGDDP